MKYNLNKLLLAIVGLLLSTTALAHHFEVDGIYYYLNKSAKTVAVTFKGDEFNSYSNEYTGSVIIPSSVTYNGTTYSVTEIGSDAFADCSGLISITIPNSVTSIGDLAFYGCTGLTELTIGNSVTEIGDLAFCSCTGLTSVNIPNSVTSIDSRAFSSCKGLTSIVVEDGNTKYDSRNNCNAIIETATNTLILGCKNSIIPNSVTSIGDYAFYGCSGLTSVTIPNSVTSIGYHAFGCSGLTELTIGNSVTEIGSWAFYGCSGLTSVTIPNSVTSITYFAFYGCTGLTSVNIPNSVTSIGDAAFYGCSGLTSVTIPNSVTSIGYSAFYGCSGLTSVTIPNSVTSICDEAFYGCSNLKSVINLSNLTFSKGSSNHGYIAYYADRVINDPNGSIVENFVFSKTDDTNILVAYFGNATDLILPTDFNGENYTIGDYAFYGCSGLTSVTIPNSVTSIGSSAFYNCSGLTEVTIPNSVTSIGDYAFEYCTGLTEVTIGNSVTEIGSSAFWGCSNLKLVINFSNLTFSKGSSDYGYVAYYADEVINGSIVGDFVFYKANNVNTLVEYLGSADELILPADVNGENYAIGISVFSGYTNLTSVTIPNSVTSIGDSAFYKCSNLTTLILEDGPEPISGLSFPNSPIDTLYLGRKYSDTFMRNKTSLVKMSIGNNVTEIGEESFYGCSNLSDVEIPNSVTKIGKNAFWNCNKLISNEVIDKTQTTVSIALATPTKFQTGIANENEKIASDRNNIFIKGLKPNTNYTYNSSLIINDIFCDIKSFSFTTDDLIFNHSDIIGATSASLKAYYEGDVTVDEYGIKWESNVVEYNSLDSISAYNLDPNTTYTVYYFLNTKEGGEYSTSWSIKTKSLTWNAGEFTATSTTSARLSVETNCDAIDGTGFEWKRYDAPDELTPNKAPCPIVNGTLKGSLRGLNPNVYYKCRPYYTSSSGKTYYGAWFAIFTGDANVYFDPEVSTSDKNIVVDNSAIINGYALAGSDDILEQGFEYWKTSTSPTTYSSSGVMIAKASGISMSATITNLEYNSTYRYRAYVKTANGSFYGSEKEFIIGNDPARVEYIESNVIDAVEIARYDIHGRRLSKPSRGLNIVIYSDGSTRKEIIKE